MDSRLASVPYKKFDAEISIIASIDTIDTIPVTIIGYEECHAELIRTMDDFILKVDGVFDIRKTGNKVPIVLEEKDCVVKVSDVVTNSVHADMLSGVSRTQTFDVRNINSVDFSKDNPSKFRCFFPTAIDNIKSFCYLFETCHYQNGTTIYSFNCISIEAGGKKYDVIQVEREEQGYYIIETLEEETYEDFKENCFAIQQSLGFLMGYMPGGQQYLFADGTFEYSRYVRPALRSFYNPVNSNSYSRLHNNREAAELYEKKLNKIPAVVFSNLVDLLRENDGLSMAVILLMEAASVKSLLLIPSVFAVIIESLAKSISVPEKGKVLPIDDSELSEKVIKELIAVIDSNKNYMKDDGALKLKNRILNINQPIVKEKLTNNEKLILPFEQLGIKLTVEDLLAIEHRNDLLHGNISLDNGDGRSSELTTNYTVHIMDRLYTLISKLLLKCAGYNGYIINHPKFSEGAAGIKTDEGHFVEI
jgi:hypothetical protein